MGGTLGATGGMAATSILLPGVGPVIIFGILGATILGAAGAIAGNTLEKKMSTGLPVDEIYVYEDALRQKRAVMIVLAENGIEADAVRAVLLQAGAESIDAAREKWWIGLRDAEKESYTARGFDFGKDEENFRRGFEAAQHPSVRGKSHEDATAHLRHRHPQVYREASFRHGYERGQTYYKQISTRAETARHAP